MPKTKSCVLQQGRTAIVIPPLEPWARQPAIDLSMAKQLRAPVPRQDASTGWAQIQEKHPSWLLAFNPKRSLLVSKTLVWPCQSCRKHAQHTCTLCFALLCVLADTRCRCEQTPLAYAHARFQTTNCGFDKHTTANTAHKPTPPLERAHSADKTLKVETQKNPKR